MKTISEAQRDNAALYRAYARRAPWNSKTRQGWLRLAEEAEACAARHDNPDTMKTTPANPGNGRTLKQIRRAQHATAKAALKGARSPREFILASLAVQSTKP